MMSPRFATKEDNQTLVDIVNHPELVPYTHADGAPPFDPNNFTDHPHSFGVMVEDGCFLAIATEANSYDIHTNILPSARGIKAIRSATSALWLAFTATDAEVLTTRVPFSNKRALYFAHMMGFRDTYVRKNAWTSGGKTEDVQYLSLSVDDWIVQSKLAKELGEHFHSQLGEDISHDEDRIHDCYVGASIAMLRTGFVGKAVRVYGRWARTASYLPFTVENISPIVVNIGTHRVKYENDNLIFERILCQPPQEL